MCPAQTHGACSLLGTEVTVIKVDRFFPITFSSVCYKIIMYEILWCSLLKQQYQHSHTESYNNVNRLAVAPCR